MLASANIHRLGLHNVPELRRRERKPNPSLTQVLCCLRFAGAWPIEELPLPPNADKLRQSPAHLANTA